MARTLALVLVTAIAVAALTNISTAARPTPGAVYKGKTGKGKKIRLKVSDSRKRLTFKVSCGDGEQSSIRGAIHHDAGEAEVN